MGKSIEVKMKVGEDELTQLLDELASATLPEIEPDEVTASMLCQRGLTYIRARTLLEKRVADGTMTRRDVYNPTSCRKEVAYRKVNQTTKEN